MGRSRHAARRRALELLYEADLRGLDPNQVAQRARAGDEPPPEFALALVAGVSEQRQQLDALIAGFAHGWTVERMAVVDRNLLRLGLWEIIHSDVPVAVAINEAVELAKELSTPESGRFVNGVLAEAARAADRAPPARGDGPPSPGGE